MRASCRLLYLYIVKGTKLNDKWNHGLGVLVFVQGTQVPLALWCKLNLPGPSTPNLLPPLRLRYLPEWKRRRSITSGSVWAIIPSPLEVSFSSPVPPLLSGRPWRMHRHTKVPTRSEELRGGTVSCKSYWSADRPKYLISLWRCIGVWVSEKRYKVFFVPTVKFSFHFQERMCWQESLIAIPCVRAQWFSEALPKTVERIVPMILDMRRKWLMAVILLIYYRKDWLVLVRARNMRLKRPANFAFRMRCLIVGISWFVELSMSYALCLTTSRSQKRDYSLQTRT